MIMRKHFIRTTVVTALIILGSTFNNLRAQVKLGVEAGYVNSTFIEKNDNSYLSLSSINNFLVGAKLDANFSKNLIFQSGLTYIEKGGFKGTTSFATSGSTSTIQLNYLQVPLNLKYEFNTKSGLKPFIGTGLYWAIGISGTEKGYYQSTTGVITPIDEKVVFTNNSSGTQTTIKPTDAGYNLLAGAAWKSWQLQASYSKGFNKVFTSGNTNIVHSVYSISLAYMFKMKG